MFASASADRDIRLWSATPTVAPEPVAAKGSGKRRRVGQAAPIEVRERSFDITRVCFLHFVLEAEEARESSAARSSLLAHVGWFRIAITHTNHHRNRAILEIAGIADWKRGSCVVSVLA
jgi:hypothetical protein